VTTVLRTLADVAASGLDEGQVRLALRQALERGLTSGGEIHHYAQERGGRFEKIVAGMEMVGEAGEIP
jgi:hypothetical protein